MANDVYLTGTDINSVQMKQPTAAEQAERQRDELTVRLQKEAEQADKALKGVREARERFLRDSERQEGAIRNALEMCHAALGQTVPEPMEADVDMRKSWKGDDACL